MYKLAALRTALQAAAPEIAAQPKGLLIAAEGGRIVATGTPARACAVEYTAKAVLLNYRGMPAVLWFALLDFVRVHQPDLMLNPQSRQQIGFAVELISHDLADVEIRLPLVERYSATLDATAPGGIAVTALPEAPMPYDLPIGPLQVTANGEPIGTIGGAPGG